MHLLLPVVFGTMMSAHPLRPQVLTSSDAPHAAHCQMDGDSEGDHGAEGGAGVRAEGGRERGG